MTPETDEERDRREFLKSCGRFAAVTPPAMTVLLSTSLTSTAIALSSGGQSFGSAGGDGGHDSFFDNGRTTGPSQTSGQASNAQGSDPASKASDQTSRAKGPDQGFEGSNQPSVVAEQTASGNGQTLGQQGGNQAGAKRSSLEVEIGGGAGKSDASLDPADHASIVTNSGGQGSSYHVTAGDLGDDDFTPHKAKVGTGIQ